MEVVFFSFPVFSSMTPKKIIKRVLLPAKSVFMYVTLLSLYTVQIRMTFAPWTEKCSGSKEGSCMLLHTVYDIYSRFFPIKWNLSSYMYIYSKFSFYVRNIDPIFFLSAKSLYRWNLLTSLKKIKCFVTLLLSHVLPKKSYSEFPTELNFNSTPCPPLEIIKF